MEFTSFDSLFYSVLAGTILFGFILTFTAYFIFKYSALQKQFLLKQIEFQDNIIKFEADLLNETNEQFRRELHDNFGSLLSITRMQLKAHMGLIKEDQQKLIVSSILMIDELIKEVKNKSNFLLQNQFYENDLNLAVERLVQSINDANSLMIDFKSKGLELKFQEKNGMQVYRMIQEMLNNAIQHSKAKVISLEMEGFEDYYAIKYFDNGCGFDVNDSLFSSGYGLKTLSERAKLIGGKLNIESRKNIETKIDFVLSYH
jgi:signal transduction histidine kinase